MKILSEKLGDVTDKVVIAPQQSGNYRTVLKCLCGTSHEAKKVFISVYGPLHMPCCGEALWFEGVHDPLSARDEFAAEYDDRPAGPRERLKRQRRER